MVRVLVLCVDRDDDLGKKARVRGPIIGREKNIEAAEKLLLADPSEADANTMFDAVKTFGEMRNAVDVVTLTGHPSRGFKADSNVRKQLDLVLKRYSVDGVYLVTNGADDDQLIPVIQSRIKILGKKNSIVREAKTLKSGYFVVKEFIRDPSIARLLFGMPGLILLIVALFQDLGVKIVVFVIGAYLILKGFGIEEAVVSYSRNFRRTTSVERASFPLYIGALLMFLLSLWGAYEKFSAAKEMLPLTLAGVVVEGFIPLFTVAGLLYYAGRIIDMHYRKEPRRMRKYAMSIVTLLAIWFVIQKAAELAEARIPFEEFLAVILIAFLGTMVGMGAIRSAYVKKFIIRQLVKGMEVYDADGNRLGVIAQVEEKRREIAIETLEGTKHPVPFARVALANISENFAVVKG